MLMNSQRRKCPRSRDVAHRPNPPRKKVSPQKKPKADIILEVGLEMIVRSNKRGVCLNRLIQKVQRHVASILAVTTKEVKSVLNKIHNSVCVEWIKRTKLRIKEDYLNMDFAGWKFEVLKSTS